jgi:nucleotide-binding universal stress UspA family protein
MLAGEALHLRKSLPRSVRIEPLVRTGAAPKIIGAVARSVKAELIVMGRGGRRALRDTFLGSTAERVIRRCQLPVLVVRLPARSRYQRPALALELDRAATPIIELMLRVIPAPRPSVAVVHAFQAPYQGLAYPSLSEEHFAERKQHLQRRASQQLAKLLDTADMQSRGVANDAPTWRRHVMYGSPRAVIEKAVAKEGTDLLVLGTHGYTGAAHVFLGTVSGDVLRHVACDVLIVPPRKR